MLYNPLIISPPRARITSNSQKPHQLHTRGVGFLARVQGRANLRVSEVSHRQRVRPRGVSQGRISYRPLKAVSGCWDA